MMLINFPILDALLTNFSVVINNCITKDRLSQPLVIKMSNMIVVNKWLIVLSRYRNLNYFSIKQQPLRSGIITYL